LERMDSGVIEEKENQVYQVTPLSVPWFPQGTVPDGPGHLFVMFLVAFVQGVLATYWFSAGIEDFSAADV